MPMSIQKLGSSYNAISYHLMAGIYSFHAQVCTAASPDCGRILTLLYLNLMNISWIRVVKLYCALDGKTYPMVISGITEFFYIPCH